MSTRPEIPKEFLAQVAFMLQLCAPEGDDGEAEIAAAVAERLTAWLRTFAPGGVAECEESGCGLPAGVLSPGSRCPFHQPG